MASSALPSTSENDPPEHHGTHDLPSTRHFPASWPPRSCASLQAQLWRWTSRWHFNDPNQSVRSARL